MKNAVRKSKDLSKKVLSIKHTDLLSEQEIRENLIDSKKWEEQLSDLTTYKDNVEEDLVGVDVDPKLKKEMDDAFEEALDGITNKIEHLVLKDKKLGLFSLAPNKVKENIVYPPAFSGNTGENVFKFVKEFKDAIDADQIRKSDQVKTLLKHIKGSAKLTVGDHFKDIDSALKALQENHGNTTLIWTSLKTELERKLGGYNKWGRPGS